MNYMALYVETVSLIFQTQKNVLFLAELPLVRVNNTSKPLFIPHWTGTMSGPVSSALPGSKQASCRCRPGAQHSVKPCRVWAGQEGRGKPSLSLCFLQPLSAVCLLYSLLLTANNHLLSYLFVLSLVKSWPRLIYTRGKSDSRSVSGREACVRCCAVLPMWKWYFFLS